jgi:type I restriction enzyme S subunit
VTSHPRANDWEIKRLRDLVTINYGRDPSAILAADGSFPVYGTSGRERFGTDYLYNGESIILGRKGTIDRVHFASGKFWTIDTAYFLSEFRGALPRWLYYFLSSIDLRRLNEATGVPSLSRELLYKIEVPKPPKAEQEKIAEILSTVDRAIDQTKLLIGKEQRIKAGLMHDLFKRGIDEYGNLRTEQSHEFKNSSLGRIPKEWKTSTLGSLARFSAGYAFKNAELSEHGWRIVRISNLHKPNFPFWHYSGRVKPSWIVRSGDTLFTWAGVASSIDCVRYSGPDALMNQHIYNLKFQSDSVKTYVFYFLQNYLPVLRREIEGGAGQLHLTKSKIQSIAIPELDAPELARTVAVLEPMEQTLEGLKQQFAKLHLIRTALMQDLLTRRRRATPLLSLRNIPTE